MRVVVTAEGAGLDAAASPVFGRCRWYVFVETDSMKADTMENPAVRAAGGAGIQAAQFVVEQGAEAVITGNVGPNACDVFVACGVPVYLAEGGSVRDAVEAHKGDQLAEAGGPTNPAHAGTAGGAIRGGQTNPKGVRQESGSDVRPASQDGSLQAPAASLGPSPSREQQISELAEMAAALRKQLAEVTDRLDQLAMEA